MNTYDSSRMLDLLRSSYDAKAVESPEQADLLLLNTCSIREKAQEKVFSELGRFRAFKEKRPNVIIGVGGCVASQEGDAILKRAPFVDLVFGPQTLHRLPEMLRALAKTRRSVVDTSFPPIEKFDELPTPHAGGVTAYVSIMEGCNKFCTYCVVPYTRGKEISRPFDDVLHEIYRLVEQGVKEITLLGQNVNAYQGPMHDGQTADLALLIRYMAEIDDLDRIRFTTSHPMEFSDRLIQAYADIPKLCAHLHLPVQSGSDRILSLMKRGHTAEHFRKRIEKLRFVRPSITITSDFIVGFPGETDEDFEDTMRLVTDVGFDQSYSFVYSARPGTPAAELPDETPMEVKKARLARLQALLTEQAALIGEQMIGTEQAILVTGTSKKDSNILSGRTDNNRIVNFEGNAPIGKIVPVRIVRSLRNTLWGEQVA